MSTPGRFAKIAVVAWPRRWRFATLGVFGVVSPALLAVSATSLGFETLFRVFLNLAPVGVAIGVAAWSVTLAVFWFHPEGGVFRLPHGGSRYSLVARLAAAFLTLFAVGGISMMLYFAVQMSAA